jgi:hypothetical protein
LIFRATSYRSERARLAVGPPRRVRVWRGGLSVHDRLAVPRPRLVLIWPALPADAEYNFDFIQLGDHNECVIVDWPEEFDRWFTNVEKQGGRLLATTVALLQALTDLPAKPVEESATFKRVRQARRHELWRVAHPFDPDFAVRIICWFPTEQNVVIALVGFDKKAIGDVFYASAAVRGEALVDAWLRQNGGRSDE